MFIPIVIIVLFFVLYIVTGVLLAVVFEAKESWRMEYLTVKHRNIKLKEEVRELLKRL